tara:strand:- start:437 stop:2092 length:1656 start_codon:yes stop_codon:yes gene_type:complete
MNSYDPFSESDNPFDNNSENNPPLNNEFKVKVADNFYSKKNKFIYLSLTVFFLVFVFLYIPPKKEHNIVEAEQEGVNVYVEQPTTLIENEVPTTIKSFENITTVPEITAPETTVPETTVLQTDTYSQDEIIEKTVQVVVEGCPTDLITEKMTGLGSGVIVSEEGHLLTNSHVIEDCIGEIYIATIDNVDSSTEISYIAEVVKQDNNLDLALLVIKEGVNGNVLPSKFEFFDMHLSSELNLGETVYIWGFPSARGDGSTYSLNINLTKGTISGFESDEDYIRGWIVTDADISYGNSGGAALNDQGELIGIPTFGVTEGASWIGYLRTADVLIDWIEEFVTPKREIEIEFRNYPQLEIREIDFSQIPKYNREDWNSWIDEDGDCQNTRHENLQLESFVNVIYSDSNSCYVQSGLWFDPYNGEYIYFSSDLHIDHFIPLYNAHLSGGWEWSEEKKTDFANNLDDPDILVAVKSFTNIDKSALSPDDWKPPNVSYWCEYAFDWIRIKAEWNLSATQTEWDELMIMLSTCPFDFNYEDAINENHTFSNEKIEKYKK